MPSSLPIALLSRQTLSVTAVGLFLLFLTSYVHAQPGAPNIAGAYSANAANGSSVAISPSGTTSLDITAVSSSSNTRLESTGAPHDWGYNSPGSSVSYSLNLTSAGTYQAVLNYASWTNTGVDVLVNGSKIASVSFSNQTDSYSTYTNSVPVAIDLPAGNPTLTLVGQSGGSNLAGIALTPVSSVPTGPAFYVSPSGNDGNSGTSPSQPFQTLERAQSAMQALGSVPYTTYLMGGTYPRTQTLKLSTYYDQYKFWLAYPGQTPVLDGDSTAIHGIDISGSTIAIQGLTLQNFQSGIYGFYGDHLTIGGNTLNSIQSPDWRSNVLGASIFLLHVNTSAISNNTINGNAATGIQVNGGGAGDINNDITVSNNVVSKTCSVVTDCGRFISRSGTRKYRASNQR